MVPTSPPGVEPNKPGKVRRVLNGASKFHGRSSNSALSTGPDLVQSLFHVTLRFRQFPCAVSADIEGMFLQMGVLVEDQPSLRFMYVCLCFGYFVPATSLERQTET